MSVMMWTASARYIFIFISHCSLSAWGGGVVQSPHAAVDDVGFSSILNQLDAVEEKERKKQRETNQLLNTVCSEA